MASPDRLLQLFHAYREQDDSSFRRAAEALISEEVMANHHALASQLQKALGPSRNGGKLTKLRQLRAEERTENGLLFFPRIGSEDMRVLFCPETKQQVHRVLEEHRQRLRLAEHGYLPKSKLLFWGPPGCGKTLSARFLSQQLGLPLGVLRLSAAVSYYLGETASRIQQAFDLAASRPMVLFLDEIDAIAKDRDEGNDIGELKRVVNSLLQAMDGFQSSHSVLLAASNHQYLLDDAAWRRFDAIIHFPLPGASERAKFLSNLLNGVVVSGSLASAIKATEGLSFADIEKAAVDAIKTMILSDRRELQASDVLDEVKAIKTTTAKARRRAPRMDIEL